MRARACGASFVASRARAARRARASRCARMPDARAHRAVRRERSTTSPRGDASRAREVVRADDGFELVDLSVRDVHDASRERDVRDASRVSVSRVDWRALTALCAVAIATCYADRSNISVAVIAMTREYGWDKLEQGLVLSAFFYGYGATQIVGGRLADARGGWAVLLFGVCAWSAATGLTPAAAGAGVVPLVAMRIALGMGEGVAFPATHALIAREVPVEKRSTAVAAVTAASYAGAALAFAATPGLVSAFGWPSAFYGFGALALVWIPFWLGIRIPESRPDEVALEERDEDEDEDEEETRRLTSEGESLETKKASAVVIWRELVSRKEVRAICVAQFTQSWGMYGLLSWLPTYFHEAQGVDIADLPAFTFVPYVLQGVLGMGVGVLADDLINVRNVPVKTVRRAAQCVGTIGPAFALLLAASPFARGNPIFAAVTVDIGLALSALTLAGVSVSHLDIAPRHAGMVFATGNTLATLAGIVAVPLSGLVLDASDQNWSLVFDMIAFMYVAGAIYWYFNLGDREIALESDPTR